MFKSYWEYHKELSYHKCFEMQIIYSNYTWAVFKFNITRNVDHPEISFEVGAFGYEFLMKIYDTRHFPRPDAIRTRPFEGDADLPWNE